MATLTVAERPARRPQHGALAPTSPAPPALTVGTVFHPVPQKGKLRARQTTGWGWHRRREAGFLPTRCGEPLGMGVPDLPPPAA